MLEETGKIEEEVIWKWIISQIDCEDVKWIEPAQYCDHESSHVIAGEFIMWLG
jgi:hypothetical protein